MMWPQLQTVAQIAIGRTLNSLPEGLLIALFAWMILRFLPRQNSGTRFAVWFVALLAVAGLPVAGLRLIGSVARGNVLPAVEGGGRPLITLPGPWGLLLFLAWVLAACAAMLRLTTGLWRLRKLRRNCVAINPAELAPSIRKTITDFSSSRPVTLATSENVSVPAALGFFKPMIVIPTWALRELSPKELSIILLHEFAHLRRWDDWTNLLQKIVRAVFFFHPAVWWIEGRLSLEREMACDDQVVAETADPHGYAKCLIALLEKSIVRRSWAMAQAAVHRAREASLRLTQILDVNRTHTRHVWKPALGFVGAFSLICLMVVPRAPNFVAFEQNRLATHKDDAHSVIRSQSQFPSAAVLPAVMRTSEKTPRPPIGKMVGRVIEHQVVEQRRTAPAVVAARWSIDADASPVDIVPVGTKETVAPREMLLVVRTTQRVGPDSWVWSVCVWRVTLVNPSQSGVERVPAANQT